MSDFTADKIPGSGSFHALFRQVLMNLFIALVVARPAETPAHNLRRRCLRKEDLRDLFADDLRSASDLRIRSNRQVT